MRVLIILISLLLFLPTTLCAGEPGAGQQSRTSTNFTGRVVDEAGAALGGAVITIKNLSTGETKSAESDDEGLFSISGVEPGRYHVNIKFEDVSIDAEASLSINQSSEVMYRVPVGDKRKPKPKPHAANMDMTISRETLSDLSASGSGGATGQAAPGTRCTRLAIPRGDKKRKNLFRRIFGG
jgi:Carboxypeptidase regulatory-like domain